MSTRGFVALAAAAAVAVTVPAVLLTRSAPPHGCVVEAGFMGAQTSCVNRRTREEVPRHAR